MPKPVQAKPMRLSVAKAIAKAVDPGDPASAVQFLLGSELRLLTHLRPEAAATRRQRMAADVYGFYRGANALACHWLTTALPADTPWVWAMGDAHPDNFATLAVGPRRADGRCPVRFDVADVDDEHPAPWCWDAVRLLAGIRLRLPKLSRDELGELATAHLDEYRRTISDHRSGDPRWTRIDLDGLPEPLKASITAESDDAVAADYLKESIDGNRLKRGKKLATAPEAEAITAILKRLWNREGMPDHELVDVASRLAGGGVASRGRRRWIALVREKIKVDGKSDNRFRLVEIKERRPSVVSRFVAVEPFPPVDRAIVTVPMGLDPFHGVADAGAGQILARTRCHARTPLDLGRCDSGDRVRAARLYGQLLAAFHCRGLSQLGADRGQLASCDRPSAANVAGWAEDLAAWMTTAYAAFVAPESSKSEKTKPAKSKPAP